MFQGKVYSYQNINGKEKSFEKTFDSYDEYRSFMWGSNMFSGFLSWGNSIFDSYLGNFFDSRMALGDGQSQSHENLPVDLNKYEDEIRKIEMSEQEKKRKREQLEGAKTRLGEYKEKFQNSGKKDLLKDLEVDMKKIDEELNSLVA